VQQQQQPAETTVVCAVGKVRLQDQQQHWRQHPSRRHNYQRRQQQQQIQRQHQLQHQHGSSNNE
jgi:hypothetical protein